MLNDWTRTTIGDQVTLQRGIDITKAQQRPGAIPVVSSGGISSYHDTAHAAGPGVVLGRKGTVGTVFYIDRDYWPHDTSLWVRDFKGNNPRFVYYFFKSIARTLISLDHGTANPTLNRNHVHPITVCWPPLPEQLAIVRVLGALDDKIELNRQMTQTLEAIARAIFQSWFVDFDPVVAKADGRQPFGMNAETASLFPDRLEDTHIGAVPAGWSVVDLPRIVDVNPKRSLAKGTEAPYLEMKRMPTASSTPDAIVRREVGSGARFINGDTLVARITPCLENGKTAFVNFLDDDEVGWGSTEYIVLRSKPPLPLEYSYFLARSDDFRAFAIAKMTGSSGRQRVPPSCLDHFTTVNPPTGILQRFGRVAGRTLLSAKQRSNESTVLAQLRDLLLPKLLRGEILIGTAEEAVAELV